MQSALKMAEAAFLADEVPVGAVIVNPVTKVIIASSHNLVEKLKNPMAHAEMLVIQSACQILSSKSLEGLDLYVTLQPCAMCIQAIIYAKIKRIYFGAYDPKVIIDIALANHKPEIYGGIDEEECKSLLDKFFVSKRI